MKVYFGGSNTSNIKNIVKIFTNKWKKYTVSNSYRIANDGHDNQNVPFILSQYEYPKDEDLVITGRFDVFGKEIIPADVYIYIMKYENRFALHNALSNRRITKKSINDEIKNEYETYLKAKNSGLAVIFVLYDDGVSEHTIEQLNNIISCYEDKNTLNACTLPTINTIFCPYFQEQEKLAL